MGFVVDEATSPELTDANAFCVFEIGERLGFVASSTTDLSQISPLGFFEGNYRSFGRELDQQDLDYFILEGLDSVYGDANLDGIFNSADLVQVFQANGYEDDVDANSTWAEGDWNGDGEVS